MYSSSKCRPAANWRTATGLLRISTVNAAFLRSALGETVNKQTLTDPTQNVRAASALCAQWRSKGRSCYDRGADRVEPAHSVAARTVASATA